MSSPPELKRAIKSDAAPATTASGRTPIAELVEDKLAYIVYQPIVDLQTKQVFSYEALCRSKSPHYKSPLDIFRDAVEQNYVGRLGRLLRAMAVECCEDRVPLFLNVHPTEFDEGWLVRPDDPIFWHEDGVYVEITESVPLSHFELCNSVLREIRGKGCFLAVDDLGAGFSNLKYISDLAPEVVKIDRELIMNVDSSVRQQKLLKSIVRLCQDMGAKVVAEGIETVGEFNVCLDAGADFGQGYLLARPAFPPPAVTWPLK